MIPRKTRKRKEKTDKKIDGALVICYKCGKTVPNAIVCVYCGAQIHDLNWVREGV